MMSVMTRSASNVPFLHACLWSKQTFVENSVVAFIWSWLSQDTYSSYSIVP